MTSVSLVSLQMVVVSDDVHEYAVALKDTEEKIARCPARVSLARLRLIPLGFGV